MDYIVLDLEWNQGGRGKQAQLSSIPFEIIEIGAVKLNNRFEVVDEFSEIVSPCVYKEMHYITKELLHLDMKELKKGDSFPGVMNRFLKWCGKDYIFCTWGVMDLTELQRNMRYHQVPNTFPYPLKYLDVQKLFSLDCEDGKLRRSLEFAIDFMGIDKEEAFHRAESDAVYTAMILQRLRKNVLAYYSVDYFRTPRKRKEEIYCVFETYSKYISREFDSKEWAMRDREVVSTRCYLCGKASKKKIRWFAGNNKGYYCLAVCENHGYLKGKIRIKKAENGKMYAVKTLKLVDEKGAGKVLERQIQMRERKALRKKAKAM